MVANEWDWLAVNIPPPASTAPTTMGILTPIRSLIQPATGQPRQNPISTRLASDDTRARLHPNSLTRGVAKALIAAERAPHTPTITRMSTATISQPCNSRLFTAGCLVLAIPPFRPGLKLPHLQPSGEKQRVIRQIRCSPRDYDRNGPIACAPNRATRGGVITTRSRTPRITGCSRDCRRRWAATDMSERLRRAADF